MFSLSSSVATVLCHICISLCYLGGALLKALLKMLQWIDLNEGRQYKTAVYSDLKNKRKTLH